MKPLVVCFSGTRDLIRRGARSSDKSVPPVRELILKLVTELPKGTIVLHGANGDVDLMVEKLARERGLVTGAFEPNWLKHGHGAGPIRTLAMLELADELHVIWDGKSRGSARAVEFAVRLGRKLNQYLYEL